MRLDFTRETPKEISDIIKAYIEMVDNGGRPGAAAKSLLNKMSKRAVTKGHFFRGVE